MNVIVFGGTGFFGKAFVSELKKVKNINICHVVRKYSDRNLANKYFHYEDTNELKKSSRIYDLAIDFASHVSVDDFLINPQQAFLDNLEIVMNNIKFLNDSTFAGKYLYISTDRAILDISNEELISNIKISNDPYGASKLVGELIVRYCANLRKGSATIARFPNIYGPGQTSRQLIPTILDKLNQGDELIELASLTGTRNYLFISDAVSALIKLAIQGGDECEVSISGENVNIETILDSFERVYFKKYSKQVKFIAKSTNLPRENYKSPPETLDDLSFRESYDWKPIVNIEQGILLTITNNIKG